MSKENKGISLEKVHEDEKERVYQLHYLNGDMLENIRMLGESLPIPLKNPASGSESNYVLVTTNLWYPLLDEIAVMQLIDEPISTIHQSVCFDPDKQHFFYKGYTFTLSLDDAAGVLVTQITK